MRVLLDTNIIIHRETRKVVKRDIGILFHWFDRLQYEKCIHPLSIDEIKKHQDPTVVASFEAKIKNYSTLKTESPEVEEIQALRSKFDHNENDSNDTSLLKEVFCKRIDLLVTEDRIIHKKARELGVSDRVFTIDDFLEKATSENPELADYKVLSVKKEYFGNIKIDDPFFESFREDYLGFADWFNKKADKIAYVCRSENDEILAFLYLKPEDHTEIYHDIDPVFAPKRRFKIGTFKVILNGHNLGERFLKIVFDNTLLLGVDEIYVTIFDKRTDQERLVFLLEDWGFRYHGVKQTPSGEEKVYVRDFTPRVDLSNPTSTYPYVSGHQRKFIVPIYPKYHTELLPDSILQTESPEDYVENRPNRNAIRKAYISRSIQRDLKPSDIIVFYRTKFGGPAHYTSVATTIGVVESVTTNIADLQEFIDACRKRSVFSNEELAKHWNYNLSDRPFVVKFLYVHSFPKRLNLVALKELKIIDEHPRGFEELSDEAFDRLMEGSHAEKRLVVN